MDDDAMNTNECNNVDIQELHEFISMEEDDLIALRKIRPVLERALYSQIRKTPEVRKFFSSETAVDNAKRAQTSHWQAIMAARFDDSYMARVRAIGEVHARIGLTPRWYVGGYTIILTELIRSVVQEAALGKSFIVRSSIWQTV